MPKSGLDNAVQALATSLFGIWIVFCCWLLAMGKIGDTAMVGMLAVGLFAWVLAMGTKNPDGNA